MPASVCSNFHLQDSCCRLVLKTSMDCFLELEHHLMRRWSRGHIRGLEEGVVTHLMTEDLLMTGGVGG